MFGTIAFLFISCLCFGQQNILNNSSLFNYYSLNSAYAGSKNIRSVGFSFQKQWLGIDGSPLTQYISYHSNIQDQNLGYGVFLDLDQIGLHRRIGLNGTFVKHNPIGSGLLSLALDFGLDQYSYDFARLNLQNPDQIIQNSGMGNSVTPDIGFSILFQNNKTIAGIKASHLLKQSIDAENLNDILRQSIHLDLLLGRAFPLSKYLILKPFLLFNYIETGQYFYDISVILTINEKIAFGASIRNNKNLNLIGHFFVSQRMRIGYSYEYGMFSIQQTKPSSFELFLGLNFSKEKGEVISPRFYSL